MYLAGVSPDTACLAALAQLLLGDLPVGRRHLRYPAACARRLICRRLDRQVISRSSPSKPRWVPEHREGNRTSALTSAEFTTFGPAAPEPIAPGPTVPGATAAGEPAKHTRAPARRKTPIIPSSEPDLSLLRKGRVNWNSKGTSASIVLAPGQTRETPQTGRAYSTKSPQAIARKWCVERPAGTL